MHVPAETLANVSGVDDVGASASKSDPAVANLVKVEEYEEATTNSNTISTIPQEQAKERAQDAQGQLATQGDEVRRLRSKLRMAEVKVGELKEETQCLNKELQVKEIMIVFLNDENSALKESLADLLADLEDFKKNIGRLIENLWCDELS